MPKYNVKLTKVDSTNQNLRSSEILGWAHDLPEYGKRFEMYSAPVDPDMDLRVISTSPVAEIIGQDDETVVFKTQNSTYKLEQVKP